MAVVSIRTNRDDQELMSGFVLPPLMQIEQPSTIALVIDSKDRAFGTNADFIIKLNYNIPRPRYLKLQRIVFPKIPNITPLNNQIQIKHAGGTTAVFSLTPGIYNTTTLSNALTNAINAAFVAAAIADTVTTVFDTITRTFRVTSVGAQNWFFIDTCSFIDRGGSMCGFTGYPVATAVSASSQYSGIAGMVYTRYLTVSSRALCQYAYASSVLSSSLQPRNVVGIVDLAGMYDASDFDVTSLYSGVYKELGVDGPNLSQQCTERVLRSEIDFQITDSYGSSLDSLLALGAPYGSNTLGVTLRMLISL